VVHTSVGGDMDTEHSSNDPLFFLHHAFLDKLWYDWQNMGHGDEYPYDKTVALDPYSSTVGEWLSPTSGCVSYQRPQAIRGLMSPKYVVTRVDSDLCVSCL
jgi:tyrosinase